MKKILLPIVFSALWLSVAAQGNVGIGTTSPVARLHVADSSVLFNGPATLPANPGPPPVSSAGNRMMWYAAKAAFRAGSVPGTQWSISNIGNHSFAANFGNIASGVASSAFGTFTVANGPNAFAIGSSTTASGQQAFAAGIQSQAIGNGSFSIGFSNTTRQFSSFALGSGNDTRAEFAFSIGNNLITKSVGSISLGAWNDTMDNQITPGVNPSERILQVGIGTSNDDRRNAITVFRSGRVGIGTTNPAARLHVADSSVVFNSTLNNFPNNPGTALVQGAGVRMVWFPNRAAFRAGAVDNGQLNGNPPSSGSTFWNADSLGRFSAAFGYRTRATGVATFATGELSWARGYAAVAMGNGARALGNVSMATGNSSAEGDYSFAANSSQALGNYSFAAGFATVALGNNSVAMGFRNKTTGQASVAMGYENEARGWQAGVFGLGNLAKSQSGFVAGIFNDTTDMPANEFQINPANRIFQIGNGLSAGNRSNAITVLQNGHVGISTVNPNAPLHLHNGSVLFSNPNLISFSVNPPAQGSGSRMMWFNERIALRAGVVYTNEWDRDSIGVTSVAFGEATRSIGQASFAAGRFTAARGNASVAMGYQTLAEGLFSTAFGYDSKAVGVQSFVAGRISEALGTNSMALGYNAIAAGEYTTALGYTTRANGAYATALGFASVATGPNALATGQNTNAIGAYSSTFGVETRAKALGGMAVGSWNNDLDNPGGSEQDADRIFQIGNGSSGLRSNALTVLRNGHVGLGNVNSPNAPLHFNNALQNRKIILYQDGNINDDHRYYGFGIQSGILRYQTDATNASHVFYAATGPGTSNELFRIQGDGNAILAGVLTQNSDATLKKNIEPIDDAGALLAQLHGYRYQWKDENADTEKQLGLLAQEVQKVLPELVKEGDNGKLGVNYSGLIPVLLEALKEQQQRIDKLERLLEKIMKQ
jgi:hypothetical protein